MPRIRKAWTYHIKGFDGEGTTFGATASKARYRVWQDCVDCLPDLRLVDIRVLRDKARDIVLPDEHRLLAELTPKQRQIVAHAYGAGAREAGYRNHYCTSPGDRDLLKLSFELGLFEGPHGERGYGETPGWTGAFFYLTSLGRDVAASMVPTYPE